MLDQRLIRENPTFVEEKLSTRGKVFNLSNIHNLTLKIKELDIELCSLQSESKKLSKIIGQEIKNSKDKESQSLIDLKRRGNLNKSTISEYEEKKRYLDKQIKYEILRLPNLPSENVPIGNNESNNIELRKWGNPLKKDNLKTHWEIGEALNLFDSRKTTKISKSRFITLTGNGARLERALINFMLDIHSKNDYLELIPPALVN